SLEEVVAMRIFDEVLPRVFDGRLVRALAAEVMRQIEGADDLIEELRVTLDRFGHDRTYPKSAYHIPISRPRRAPEQSPLRFSRSGGSPSSSPRRRAVP